MGWEVGGCGTGSKLTRLPSQLRFGMMRGNERQNQTNKCSNGEPKIGVSPRANRLS